MNYRQQLKVEIARLQATGAIAVDYSLNQTNETLGFKILLSNGILPDRPGIGTVEDAIESYISRLITAGQIVSADAEVDVRDDLAAKIADYEGDRSDIVAALNAEIF